MRKAKRITTILAGVVIISLVVIANVWAFGVGNVDGVWGTADTDGATCDGWASAGIPAFSTTLPSIQSSGGNITDENRVAYGTPENASGCPTTWSGFQLQSGFGFNGINGPISATMDVPFYLGSFTHYNNPIYSPDNRLSWVDLDLVVPIDCDNNGTTDTSFTFSPRFNLDETTNNANPCPYKPGDPVNSNGCADAVTITQPATTTFTCSSVPYTVNIYGFTSNADCSTVFDPNAVSTQYITKEKATNNACLWAEIDKPNADTAVTKSCTGFDGASPYYTITVTNAGPGTALGAKVVDTLPNGVIFKSYTSERTVNNTTVSQGSCSVAGQVVTCDLNSALPEKTGDPSAKWVVKIYVDYSTGVNWINNVVLSTTSTDPDLSNNTARAECGPNTSFDLGVVKSDGDYSVTPYPAVDIPYKYTVTVSYPGPGGVAEDVEVVDTLDTYLDYLSDTDAGHPLVITINGSPVYSTCTLSALNVYGYGGTLTCPLGDLNPGDTAVVEFWVKAVTGVATAGINETGECTQDASDLSDVCNLVEVKTTSNDPYLTNNKDSEPKDIGAPTAVDVLSFKAKATSTAIVLKWETANEFDIIGFNLYRAGSKDGARTLINSTQSENFGGVTGAPYKYKDLNIKPGKTYFYWLEIIGSEGSTFYPGVIKIKR